MPNQTQTINKDGLPQDVLDYIDGLEGENQELASALDVASQELAKGMTHDEDDDDDFEEVIKGLPDEVVDIIKGLESTVAEQAKELKTQAEIIDGERDIRLTAEQVAKAAELKLGEPTKLAQILKSVAANCGQETYDSLWGVLSGASEQIEKSGLFNERGSDQDGPLDSPQVELQRLAEENIAKGMSTVDAYRNAVRDNPHLYTQKEG